MSPNPYSVLFVCSGNICRSPLLMAMLRKLAKQRGVEGQIKVDSCALTAWFLGEPVDPRMVVAAQGKSLSLDHRARLIDGSDFARFDLIMPVDHDILTHVQSLAREEGYRGEVCLATTYSRRFNGEEIQDPYYGGPEGFQTTIEMAEDSCLGLLDHLVAIKRISG